MPLHSKCKNVKVKLSLYFTKHHAMNAYLGSGGIAPHILWPCFMPWPLYTQGKSPWYPLAGRLGGAQSHSGRGGEEKNAQPPPWIEPLNPNRPACSPVLYQLSYHGKNFHLRLPMIIFFFFSFVLKMVQMWVANSQVQGLGYLKTWVFLWTLIRFVSRWKISTFSHILGFISWLCNITINFISSYLGNESIHFDVTCA
jgi:hypothetical protein